MKVILISKVANYGNIGDVVDVKDGYARNFLIPTNKAIHYSKANYKVFEDQKKEFEAKNKELLAAADKNSKAISGKEVTIIENASDDGRLYGAVNNTIIATKVSELAKDLEVSRADIVLEKPIKDTGVYDVQVNLYADISAQLQVVVARSEDEIETVKKQAKADEEKARKEKKEEVKAQVTSNESEEETAKEEPAAESQEEEKLKEEAAA